METPCFEFIKVCVDSGFGFRTIVSDSIFEGQNLGKEILF